MIKDLNRFLVLQYIRQSDRVSRTDIAKATKMGLSTVMNITDEFLQEGLIQEVGTAASTGGRKPVLLQFNKAYSFTFGIKIEEARLRIALTNLRAEVLDIADVPFAPGSKAPAVLGLLAEHIAAMRDIHGLALSQIAGIGIASSGLINRKAGRIVRSSLLGWDDAVVCEEISSQFGGIPVYLDKNINAYTLAELMLGMEQDAQHIVVMSIGAGLGMTMVVDGRMYYGSFGGAGELGHTIVQMDGYRCHCGQKGCLEMYASEFYLRNAGPKLREQYPDTAVKKYTFYGVSEALAKEDPLALRLMGEMGRHIGYGLVNVIHTLNPKRIVLTGEGMEYASYFLPQALDTAKENFFAAAQLPTEIVVSELADTAWLQGAALLAIQQLFQLPIYENQES